MKARADFEQAADAATQINLAFGRRDDSAEHLQQRGLAGAVAADDADHFARADVEGDILEGPKISRLGVDRLAGGETAPWPRR